VASSVAVFIVADHVVVVVDISAFVIFVIAPEILEKF